MMINKQVLVGFAVGVIVGAALWFLIDSFVIKQSQSFSLSDKINVAAIFVNIIIGVAIVLIIQKKLSDDRGVKDYFIKEISDIIDEYKKFNNGLFRGDYRSQYILQWFKLISIRISHLEKYLSKDLKVKALTLRGFNRAIHLYITGSDGFNESFRKKTYTPSSKEINRFTDLFDELKSAFIMTIIKINRS